MAASLGHRHAAATDLELTTAWGVNAAYEHFWNPRWRTSLYGGYAAVSYNDTANAMLCELRQRRRRQSALVTNGCDMNWKTWWIGSRTQWNVTKDFYMGVDVLYQKLETANDGLTALTAALGTAHSAIQATGASVPAKDMDNVAVRFRVHRDFYP